MMVRSYYNCQEQNIIYLQLYIMIICKYKYHKFYTLVLSEPNIFFVCKLIYEELWPQQHIMYYTQIKLVLDSFPLQHISIHVDTSSILNRFIPTCNLFKILYPTILSLFCRNALVDTINSKSIKWLVDDNTATVVVIERIPRSLCHWSIYPVGVLIMTSHFWAQCGIHSSIIQSFAPLSHIP